MRKSMALFLIPALALSACLIGCGKEEAPPPEIIRPVKTIKVAPARGGLKRTFSGAARAAQEASLAFRVGGKVVEIRVDVGDEVKKGQVLARLDAHDYELDVKNLESNLESSRAAAKSSENSYQRAKGLYENNSISKDDLDAAEAQRNSDRAQVEAFEAQLEQSRNQLSYAELKAPFGGFVSNKSLEEFETVSAGQAVMSLIDPGSLKVKLGIPEGLIARVKAGQEVAVTFESLPDRTFAGKVSEVDVALDGATGTYPVTVKLVETGAGIRPGMAAEVTFSFEFKGGPGIVVPTSAILEDIQTGERYVWVYRDGRVKKNKVETGTLVTEGIEIVSGLAGGEEVVTAGVTRIEEGQEVRLLSE